ncbi:MAG: glyoxylase-like metal-dependent hydrolase (beta-lactamase superfamily II) [Halieaceae bacterium]|jgi:glyoxylase-like metal-dependent hydrolase (beta-lactamase superfamily II)
MYSKLSNMSRFVIRNILGFAWLLLLTPYGHAGPGSGLVVTQVAESVFSAVGATTAPDYANAGHNNNLSFIVTTAGVMVVNGGDNFLLAKALHQQIKAITSQPVRWLVNENGQGHAFLGNSYWAAQGVMIIAHEEATAEMKRKGQSALRVMQERNREKSAGTFISLPTHSFGPGSGNRYIVEAGETRIELLHFGPAHSPGDISVWLPQSRVLIAGDIAFHERLLGIFPDTDVAGWVDSFAEMAALLPTIVVPGHGRPTDLGTLKKYTLDYLVFLQNEIEDILTEGGDLEDAYKIDQSAYSQLDTFEELAAKNAGRLYQTMEMKFF